MKELIYLNGAGLIARERIRQVNEETYTTEHDEPHVSGELRDAAISYAQVCDDAYGDIHPSCWPWADNVFKPDAEHPVKNLIKAGALLAAEIDRHRARFRKECDTITMRDFGFECFDPMDVYQLERAEWVGVTPEEFVKEHLADDYASLELNEEIERQPEEHQQAEVFQDGYEED